MLKSQSGFDFSFSAVPLVSLADMGSEAETFSQLEIAHVLFADIVGYSKKPIDQQSELLGELNRVVRATEQFKAAEAGAGV